MPIYQTIYHAVQIFNELKFECELCCYIECLWIRCERSHEMLHQRIRRQKLEENLQFQSKNYNPHIVFKVKTKTGLHLTNINMDWRPLVHLVIKLSDLFLLLQKIMAKSCKMLILSKVSKKRVQEFFVIKLSNLFLTKNL